MIGSADVCRQEGLSAVFPADSSHDRARMSLNNRISPAGPLRTSTFISVWESLSSPSSAMSFILCFFLCPHGTVTSFALPCAADVGELAVSR